ncbi:MAG: VanW family protein [Abditibacteriota bacterium]|nr:VanW family protein [Abditibacteriota bacterium]
MKRNTLLAIILLLILPAALWAQDTPGVCLGRYTTGFNAKNAGRTSNLKVAVKKLNGTSLQPGGVFSFNKTLGERTAAAGYREAIVFQGGEQKLELGGGICQVSSTLFNAALLAGMEILSRRSHSKMVDYVPAGRDAMVYWGQQDFSFRNNSGSPVVIKASVDGSTMTVALWGSADSKKRCTVTSSFKNNGKSAVVKRIVESGSVKTTDYISSSSYTTTAKKAMKSSTDNNVYPDGGGQPAAPPAVETPPSPGTDEGPAPAVNPDGDGNEGIGFEEGADEGVVIEVPAPDAQ